MPDPILAELWEVKRQINQEAGYRLQELTRMAKESANRIRRQRPCPETQEIGRNKQVDDE
ncbi:hypothetical protein [uncultured Thiocystis sp.]|uniref:hypothetical protein n=1 Tax=uncultured Thiocystis sp. TaxID=1202134 RepID=UPI0025FB77AF|nr:hypothetical protein [uncultured Thiocystis sp.]